MGMSAPEIKPGPLKPKPGLKLTPLTRAGYPVCDGPPGCRPCKQLLLIFKAC